MYKILPYLDHRSHCRGDRKCPGCGRLMCEGCTTMDRPEELRHNEGHKGECLVCSGMYAEKDIILHPVSLLRANFPKRRLIRLNV